MDGSGGFDPASGIGHNSAGLTVAVEVRMFNSVTRFAGPEGHKRRLEVPVGTTVGDLADRLAIPRSELFLVLVNGRDITPGLVGAAVEGNRTVEEGDVVAFSGAVPYSYGYGSPVV